MTRARPGRLESGASSILGRALTAQELGKFGKYLDLLVEWQGTHRLIGSRDPEWIIDNVLVDSLLFTRVLPGDSAKILDLGAGAGIPGIPLAIVLEHSRVTLVESRQKRASFLAHALRELPLRNATLMRARLSVGGIPEELVGAFDAVVMRCAGGPGEVIPIGLELVKPGGVVILSGPPRAGTLEQGEWVTVPGAGVNSYRRFAVVVRPTGPTVD